jgi:excisionase family DNA binding protein
MYKQRRNSSLASKAFRLTAGDVAGNRIEDDEILTASQVSNLLKLHHRTIYKLAQSGIIRARRLGKSWRFLKGSDYEVFRKKGYLAPWNQNSANGTAEVKRPIHEHHPADSRILRFFAATPQKQIPIIQR